MLGRDIKYEIPSFFGVRMSDFGENKQFTVNWDVYCGPDLLYGFRLA